MTPFLESAAAADPTTPANVETTEQRVGSAVPSRDLLALRNVEAKYQGSILVLKGVSLTVPEGKIVTLLGPNGAGKTTTLHAISGLLSSEEGAVTKGSIIYDGEDITSLDASVIVKRGIVQVLEGRRVLEHMSVEHNLLVAVRKDEATGRYSSDSLEEVYGYFPELADVRTRSSGYLSGGQQQMLVLGRAIMARPRLLLLDEPSLGLAPLIVARIYDFIRELNNVTGVSMVLVEQNARIALEVADYGYVLEGGRVVLDGPADQLKANEDLREFYLGLGNRGERKSFRDVKHYRRRKRWLG